MQKRHPALHHTLGEIGIKVPNVEICCRMCPVDENIAESDELGRIGRNRLDSDCLFTVTSQEC